MVKAKMSPLATIVTVLVGIVAVLFIAGSLGLFPQEGVGSFNVDSSSCNVDADPTIDLNVRDAINADTTVTAGMLARVNGVYEGIITESTKFTEGDKVELILNATNYIDVKLPEFEIGCGVNRVTSEMYATSTNTFRVFNTDGNPVTDNIIGGATNQSAAAAPISLDVKLDSTADESTGNLIVVIEADNTTEVDSIKLSGNGVSDATVPEFYSAAAANSITDAYAVPALLDGETKAYTLTLSPESGETIGGEAAAGTGIYITAYSSQAYVDRDGSLQVGIEDSDGNTKYEDTFDFDLFIT